MDRSLIHQWRVAAVPRSDPIQTNPTPRTESAPVGILPFSSLALHEQDSPDYNLGFVSCGLSEDTPDAHQEELDGTTDSFDSTNTSEVPHSNPIRSLGPGSPFSGASCLSSSGSTDDKASQAKSTVDHVSAEQADYKNRFALPTPKVELFTPNHPQNLYFAQLVNACTQRGNYSLLSDSKTTPHQTGCTVSKPPSGDLVDLHNALCSSGLQTTWQARNKADHLLDTGSSASGADDTDVFTSNATSAHAMRGILPRNGLLPPRQSCGNPTSAQAAALSGPTSQPSPLLAGDQECLASVMNSFSSKQLERLLAMDPSQMKDVILNVMGSQSTPPPATHAAPPPGPHTPMRLTPQVSSYLPALLPSDLLSLGLPTSMHTSPLGHATQSTPHPNPRQVPASYGAESLASKNPFLRASPPNAPPPTMINIGHVCPSAAPAAAMSGEGAWEDLTQNVRDRVQNMIVRCEPHIKLVHFDGGVRHWLAQLTSLFGEAAALAGLATIEQATNLVGVRNMRAFITTRLIDCFEQNVFLLDPCGYAARHLVPEQYQMLEQLINMGQGLKWTHFDPKVLETIRDLDSLEYTRTRLSRLSARELASVQNVPAYIYTLLSKRGKTAKQAAVAKGTSENALCAYIDATFATPSSCGSGAAVGLTPLPVSNGGVHSPLQSRASALSTGMFLAPEAATTAYSHQGMLPLQLAHTLGPRPMPAFNPSTYASTATVTAPYEDKYARIQEDQGMMGIRSEWMVPQHTAASSYVDANHLQAVSLQQHLAAAQYATPQRLQTQDLFGSLRVSNYGGPPASMMSPDDAAATFGGAHQLLNPSLCSIQLRL